MRSGLILALVLCASPVEAQAPADSLRPVARAGTDARNGVTGGVQLVKVAAATGPAMSHSLRPNLRTKSVVQKAMAKRNQLRKGAVCGDLDIQGEPVGRVPGKLNGCGISDAVRVRAVSGIRLSQASVMQCGTAKALKTWIEKGAKPAIGSKGGGLATLKVAAHYSCRTRNNKTGAKISEHGKGKAIDISGYTLNDGTKVTVLNGWSSRAHGRALKRMHKAACGPFGTVLGPQADRYHQDHFHFDIARYRSGPYCR